MPSKAPKKPALRKLATIAHPNRMGVAVADPQSGARTLYLLETKVSDDFLPAFPEATAAKLAAYDLTDPAQPVRRGACEVRAAWSFVVRGQSAYVLLGRKVTDTSSVMDLAVVDLTEPHQPRLVTTLEDVGSFGPDSKSPVLVVSGAHLLVSTRTQPALEVFSLAAPLAPKKVATVTLSNKPQAAFADDAGALVTFLGNDTPMVELTGSGASWSARPIAPLTGSLAPARLGGKLFRATGESNNHLGVFDASGKTLSSKKLGPTSIEVATDGERIVTLGDALSVWSSDAELLAKKNGVEATQLSTSAGLILAPQRPNASATDKRKAFAFDVWTFD